MRCNKCRDNGFPNTMVYLAGKDEHGKTIQLEEDGSRQIHKTKQRQQQVQPQEPDKNDNPLAPVSDESVESGFSAFTMMTDLIRLVEQTQKLLVIMDGKLDRLLNLAGRKQ
jgi:hypothetical protein